MELKPCRYCGGPATLEYNEDYEDWWLYHKRVDELCPVQHVTFYRTKLDAIYVWNAEGEWVCRNVADEWNEKNSEGASTSFYCSRCGAHYQDMERYAAELGDKDGNPIRTNFCPWCGAKVMTA